MAAELNKRFSFTVTQKQRTLQPNSVRLLPSFDPVRNYLLNAYLTHSAGRHHKQPLDHSSPASLWPRATPVIVGWFEGRV